MTNNQLTDLRTLILSEVGDFFAGFGSPGEPETPEKMQIELSMRLGRILNPHRPQRHKTQIPYLLSTNLRFVIYANDNQKKTSLCRVVSDRSYDPYCGSKKRR